MTVFDVGDVVPLSFETYVDGSYVDPTTVTRTVEQPNGALDTVTASRVSLGRYRADFVTAQQGLHRYWWSATGPGARTQGDVFNTRPLASLGLISVQDAKQHLNMADDANDEELRPWIGAATRIIERHVGEIVARRPFTEFFTASGSTGVRVDRRPIVSVTALATVDGAVAYSLANLSIEDADRGIVRITAGPRLSGYLRIDYIAGYAVVPDNYLGAAAIIAAHLWETQHQPGLGPRGPFGGEETITPSGMGFAIPNRAVELLGGRPPVVA